MLGIILQATFYIIKFANIIDTIFSIMPNALRCDFYWRPSQIVFAFWQMSKQLMNRMSVQFLYIVLTWLTYVCSGYICTPVLSCEKSCHGSTVIRSVIQWKYLPYVWKCSRYKIFMNFTNDVTLANISHRCTSLVRTVLLNRHVKNNWALLQASRQ